jgi:hypothetical protein
LKAILAGAALLLAITSAAIAGTSPEPNPLATRRGFEVGGQIASYNYEEPGLMKLIGPRVGGVGSFTFAAAGLFFRTDSRFSYGQLKYRSPVSGTLNRVPDFILEPRFVIGKDFPSGDGATLSPYGGLGYRYLYDDLRGYASTGAAGYRRSSHYFYAPVGLTLRIHLENRWVLAPTVEADVFLRGRQVTKLSDTGLGYIDVTNEQKKGRGHRASLMLEKDRWVIGAWTHYWHIADSDLQFAGVVGGIARGGLEPENYTREYGLELRYRF